MSNAAPAQWMSSHSWRLCKQLIVAGLSLTTSGMLAACHPVQAPSESHGQMSDCDDDPPVVRGKYLVRIAGCSDCHTPMKMGEKGPEPDLARYLSGHPQELKMPPVPKLADGPWVWVGSGSNTCFAGPWGVTYAANLTPDQQTGLGIWTEEMFMSAMRTGKHFGQARPIQPPMPWEDVGSMTDSDLKAVFTYLQSVPAVKNQVPEYQPPAQ